MPDNVSLWSFVSHADGIVQSVLLLLLIASIFSWTIIVQRVFLLKGSWRLLHRFAASFKDGLPLAQYKKMAKKQGDVPFILEAALSEYERLRHQSGMTAAIVIENCQRVMAIAQHTCMQPLEQSIGVLATIGSTAPYVGLLGTVWGIMSSFRMLGGAQQATLAMVAPGIAEALIATAVGLCAAIPAVVAYNRFTHQVGALDQEYEIFQQKITGLLQQQVVSEGDIL